jgi:hypothetical protein
MTEEQTQPAIGISYSAQTGDGRNLVFQTHVPQDCLADQLDGIVDKLRKAADRQLQFGKIDTMNQELEMKDRIIKQLVEGIAAVDAKSETVVVSPNGSGRRYQKNQVGLTNPNEVQQRKNALISLEAETKWRNEIVQKRDSLRAELG